MSVICQNLLIIDFGVTFHFELKEVLSDLSDLGDTPALVLLVSFEGIYFVSNLEVMSPLLFLLLLNLEEFENSVDF